MKIALYSPDSYGLGHFRRNRRIAAALVGALPEATVLILTGCPAADKFEAIARTDIVRMPAATKSASGAYVARSLVVDPLELSRLRSGIIQAALEAFRPDIFIADHAPAGRASELLPALEAMHGEGRRPALMALGLRDILDDAASVRRQWLAENTYDLLHWAYDEVWVYGRPEVFDPVAAYGIPTEVANRVHYLGYLMEPQPQARPAARRRRVPVVVAMGGGGEDAYPLLEVAVEARRVSPFRFRLAVLPGPLMAPTLRRRLQASAAAIGPDVTVQPFTQRTGSIVAGADCVVTMAGYNSLLETIAAGVPSLVVPRVAYGSLPYQEQLIRARRMSELGWTSWLHPELLEPATLLDRIRRLLGTRPARMPAEYLGGLAGLVQRCQVSIAAEPGEERDVAQGRLGQSELPNSRR